MDQWARWLHSSIFHSDCCRCVCSLKMQLLHGRHDVTSLADTVTPLSCRPLPSDASPPPSAAAAAGVWSWLQWWKMNSASLQSPVTMQSDNFSQITYLLTYLAFCMYAQASVTVESGLHAGLGYRWCLVYLGLHRQLFKIDSCFIYYCKE